MYYSLPESTMILSLDNVWRQATNFSFRFDVMHDIEGDMGHIYFISYDNKDSSIDMIHPNGH